ncbi:MAG: DNRLRE domain-containing protein, partial [Candidatus Sulfotelmatobacter sp.]
MTNLNAKLAAVALCTVFLLTGAYAQLTPSGDAYTNTGSSSTNYGANVLLDVVSGTQTTYIQFNLASIPAGYTSTNVAKATLKLYVNAVSTAGSFNVDYVSGAWSEATITAKSSPALGSTIVSAVPLTSASPSQYILIDITSAVQAWLNGTEANNGIALVANSPLN